MTTKQELSGKWNTIVGKVKQKYGQISDSELRRVEGDLNQLAGLIQQKTGQTREQVENYFDECCASSDSMLAQASEHASEAGDAIRQGYDYAADQARRSFDSSVRTVSRRPLESVGLALGVGLLVGLVAGVSIGMQRQRESAWAQRWSR